MLTYGDYGRLSTLAGPLRIHTPGTEQRVTVFDVKTTTDWRLNRWDECITRTPAFGINMHRRRRGQDGTDWRLIGDTAVHVSLHIYLLGEWSNGLAYLKGQPPPYTIAG